MCWWWGSGSVGGGGSVGGADSSSVGGGGSGTGSVVVECSTPFHITDETVQCNSKTVHLWL